MRDIKFRLCWLYLFGWFIVSFCVSGIFFFIKCAMCNFKTLCWVTCIFYITATLWLPVFVSAPEPQPQCDLHLGLATEGWFEGRERGKIFCPTVSLPVVFFFSCSTFLCAPMTCPSCGVNALSARLCVCEQELQERWASQECCSLFKRSHCKSCRNKHCLCVVLEASGE